MSILILGHRRAAAPLVHPELLPPVVAQYSGGVPGAIYDPGKLSSLFQDQAGAVPVTAAGQLVARILDLSPNGSHITVTDLAKRPTLRTDTNGEFYLDCGGSTPSCFVSDNDLDFSTHQGLTICTAYGATVPAGSGVLAELTQGSYTYNGAFTIWAPDYGNDVGWYVRGTARQAFDVAVTDYPATKLFTGQANLLTDHAVMRINGSSVLDTTTSFGGGLGFANDKLYVAQRANSSDWFTGRLYRTVLIGIEAVGPGLAAIEAYVNETSHVI